MDRTDLITFFTLIALISPAVVISGTASACSVLDKEPAHLGVSEGFRGTCSNNGFPITCVSDDNWITCEGPGGSHTGTDLEGLIFSACRCHAQEEREKEMQQQLEDY